MRHLVLDTSVIVAQLDARDSLHQRGVDVMEACDGADIEPTVLDCVVLETIGVTIRRFRERRVEVVLPDFAALFPAERITPSFRFLERGWPAVHEAVKASTGRMNATDALILCYARHEQIPYIVSFDAGFKGLDVPCLSTADEVRAAVAAAR